MFGEMVLVEEANQVEQRQDDKQMKEQLGTGARAGVSMEEGQRERKAGLFVDHRGSLGGGKSWSHPAPFISALGRQFG